MSYNNNGTYTDIRERSQMTSTKILTLYNSMAKDSRGSINRLDLVCHTKQPVNKSILITILRLRSVFAKQALFILR